MVLTWNLNLLCKSKIKYRSVYNINDYAHDTNFMSLHVNITSLNYHTSLHNINIF